MDLKSWNEIQSSLFLEYNVKSNIDLLLTIARDIGYLKSSDIQMNEELLRDIIEQSIINHTMSIINDYKDQSKLEYIYSNITNKCANNCTIEDYKQHLNSKIILYKQFKTEKLHNTINKIINLI